MSASALGFCAEVAFDHRHVAFRGTQRHPGAGRRKTFPLTSVAQRQHRFFLHLLSTRNSPSSELMHFNLVEFGKLSAIFSARVAHGNARQLLPNFRDPRIAATAPSPNVYCP